VNLRHIKNGLRAVDLLEIVNNLQNRWLGTVEVQARVWLKRVAPWRAEENDDEMIGRMPPRAHEVLVTAADEFDRRVEVRDIPGRQVEDGGLNLKTDALRAHNERRSSRIQDFFDDLAVVDLSTSDAEVQWSTLAIDDRMDFRGPPATADANRLIFLPPFAPPAARCAFTIVLSIKYKLSRDFAARASKIRFQTPRRDQRLNRLYALVYGP
jgi:hypothetical protein